jgi:hypothetical protein
MRYSLDLLMTKLFMITSPGSIRIASNSLEIVKAVVRRLAYHDYFLIVENQAIQKEILGTFGIQTHILESYPHAADVAVFPFSLEEGCKALREPVILTVCHNAFSYKSLLYPRSIRWTVYNEIAKLKADYEIEPYASLYSPRFILRWSLAKAVERLRSSWFFRLEDVAMRRLIDFSPLWRLSYIVVLAGRLSG